MKDRGFSQNFTTAAIIVGLSQFAGHAQSRPNLKGASIRGPDNETACIEAEGEPAEDQSRLDGDEGVLNALLSHADGVPPGFVIIEGDIIVPEDFLNPVVAASYTTSIWPGGVVPYEFDANVSSATQTAVLHAMGEWEARADIEFRPRATDTAYVHISQTSSGNYSYIGHSGVRQYLGVTAGGGAIRHELGHTLGYWHEQSRMDRDAYVRINWDNLGCNGAPCNGNFDVRANPGGEFGPYDFASVMHYHECAFSVCVPCPGGCETITVLPPNESWQHLIGRPGLSEWDARGMGFLYGFSGPDCNTNYIRDGWDISAGTSRDCDRNGLPDECDLADGAADCTGNGIPDTCERFPDCDGSGQADFNELCIGLTPDCLPVPCGVHEDAKLTASDAAQGGRLRTSVSVSGDVVLVGGSGQGDCPVGANCGAVYVYRFNPGAPGRWVEEQQLRASDPAHVDDFSFSVSVDGSVAVVGAREDSCPDPGCGSAYVYRFDGSAWVDEGRLAASDGTFNVWLASPVSVSGDVVVVGAFGDQCTAGILCGSAYVFRFNGSHWQQEQKLTASDAAYNDRFGFKVSISGNVAVAGANRRDCDAALDCGAAYVYRFNPGEPGHWMEEQELIASDAEAGDEFGYVSVSGDVAVVGAPKHNCSAGPDCGAAYVYRFNGSVWVEEAKLTASDAVPNDNFGSSVSVSGDTVVVGGWRDDCAPGLDCGSAYVYRFHPGTPGYWVEQRKLTPSDAVATRRLDRVAVSGDVVVVGASQFDSGAGSICCAAYVFGIGDCNADGVADACAIATCSGHPGCADCNSNAIPDECDQTGDFDGDGRLQLTDYATFFLCRTDVCDRMLCDPPLYPVSCCGLADANFDGAIDLRDYAVFQQEFSLMP